MSARPRRILVGYDGSEVARRALDAAAGLMSYGSTMAVLGIGNGSVAPDLLEQARERLYERQVQALYLEAAGDPAEQVALAAAELDVDLVVIGRENGNGSASRSRLGSVSAEIVRRVPCDVLVVR